MKSYNQPGAAKKILILLVVFLAYIEPGTAQQPSASNRTLLGELSTGEKVYTIQNSAGSDWGLSVIKKDMEVAGQQKPLKLEFYENDNKITDLDGSYKSVSKTTERPGQPAGPLLLTHNSQLPTHNCLQVIDSRDRQI